MAGVYDPSVKVHCQHGTLRQREKESTFDRLETQNELSKVSGLENLALVVVGCVGLFHRVLDLDDWQNVLVLSTINRCHASSGCTSC